MIGVAFSPPASRRRAEFVQGQHDEELWDELISNSLDSPELVGALLERIGRYTVARVDASAGLWI